MLNSALNTLVPSSLISSAGRRTLEPILRRYFAPRTLDRAALRSHCVKEGYFMESFGEEYTVTFDSPITLPGEMDDTRGLHGSKTVDPPFVCELPEVGLYGFKALKSMDGQFINANWSLPEFVNSAIVSLSNGTLPFPNRRSHMTTFDIATPLVGVANRGYSHWLVDYLSLLEGVEYYTECTGREPTIIVPPDPPTWMRDSLELMGYGPDDYVEWNARGAWVKRLVLPTTRRIRMRDLFTGNWWVASRIREGAGVDGPRTASKRIYVSRSDASSRRVVNEDDVMDRLDALGFTRYRLADISFRERVELFSRAEVIAGPHGAGLAYMMFAPNASVLELFGVKRNYNYYSMANCLDCEYGRLRCEPEGRDIVVDIDDLETILQVITGDNALEGGRATLSGGQ